MVVVVDVSHMNRNGNGNTNTNTNTNGNDSKSPDDKNHHTKTTANDDIDDDSDSDDDDDDDSDLAFCRIDFSGVNFDHDNDENNNNNNNNNSNNNMNNNGDPEKTTLSTVTDDNEEENYGASTVKKNVVENVITVTAATTTVAATTTSTTIATTTTSTTTTTATSPWSIDWSNRKTTVLDMDMDMDIDMDMDSSKQQQQQQQQLLRRALELEQDAPWKGWDTTTSAAASTSTDLDSTFSLHDLQHMAHLLATGQYAAVLNSPVANDLFRTAAAVATMNSSTSSTTSTSSATSIPEQIQTRIHSMFASSSSTAASTSSSSSTKSILPILIQLEWIGVAALNLFLQANYTGPALDAEEMSQPTGSTTTTSTNTKTTTKSKSNTKTTWSCLLPQIHPHACFATHLKATTTTTSTSSSSSSSSSSFQNAVLAELAVDGEWPVQVCQYPYFLLLARSILSTVSTMTLATTSKALASMTFQPQQQDNINHNNHHLHLHLKGAIWWNARAVVAHERLLQHRQPSETLYREVAQCFQAALDEYHPKNHMSRSSAADSTSTDSSTTTDNITATLWLEYGLAQFHFEREGSPDDDDNNNNNNNNNMGKSCFLRAQQTSGLNVHVTGSLGKRTKYQQTSLAQMLVRAESKQTTTTTSRNTSTATSTTQQQQQQQQQQQMIPHAQDEILLERIQYEDSKDNEVTPLTILDQSILLALCLDVKAHNPSTRTVSVSASASGSAGSGQETSASLTAEEMGAYLARVLNINSNDNDNNNNNNGGDWMIYSTALLERAWLEFERSHARERALLQMQALADQHSNRLTLTQSTFASIEEYSTHHDDSNDNNDTNNNNKQGTAPVQDRLRHVHGIVYPPRWSMIQDMADRYVALGLVTSAAELYTDIDMWDDVVECYTRAGKKELATSIVQQQLAIQETPRMWNALGNLLQDPVYYQKAIELSNGCFSLAYLSLGHYYFGQGNLQDAATNYQKALSIRPLQPSVWFRLGTIYMQTEQWSEALKAMTEVVQQSPDQADAWANIAAVHMRNKHPVEAYPALQESLKYNRSNWRVWTSQLYTCLDLKKYNQAIQACHEILNLREQKQASDEIPPLEERCVKAIVGGALQTFHASGDVSTGSSISLESARQLLSRVHALLDRLASKADHTPENAWIFSTMNVFHAQALMKSTPAAQETTNSTTSTSRDSHAAADNAKFMLEGLMKEYRGLLTVLGWEKDDKLVARMTQVVAQIVYLYRNSSNDTDASSNNLVEAKFLTRSVLQRIQKARAGQIHSHMPTNDLTRLQDLLDQIQTDLDDMKKK